MAALKSGRSLLPVGVIEVHGEFERGAAVACIAPGGTEVARGLSNYGSGEARLIARKSTAEIESLLKSLESLKDDASDESRKTVKALRSSAEIGAGKFMPQRPLNAA